MIILDIREKEEFEAERIPGSIFCPMSQFDLLAPGILKNLKNEEVVLMCRSGNRAKLVMNDLSKIPADHLKFSVFEGGIQRWKKEGKPLEGGGVGGFPIMRQVQIFASTLIFVAFILSHFFNPQFIYLALFAGFGLALAGWTGICPAAIVLKRMPWSKGKTGVKL